MIQFLKILFNYRNFKKLPSEYKRISFYSESAQDYHFLEPLINGLLQKNYHICFFSSDKKDYGLQHKHPNLHPFFIGNGTVLLLMFKTIKTKIFIMTMSALDIWQCKRSIHDVHYIYIPHSMVSMHLILIHEHEFTHYDTILCPGPNHIEGIRAMEKHYSTPPKDLVHAGYYWLDQLLKKEKKIYNNNPKKILFAPSWDIDVKKTTLYLCGEELIDNLIKKNYHVILRPHPQTMIRHPKTVTHIIEKYKDNPLFSFEEQMSNIESFEYSDLMICDWSGAALEYAFGFEKPILFIDIPIKNKNPNYEKLKVEAIEIYLREKIGKIINPNNISDAPAYIETMLNDNQFKNKIKKLREDNIYNLGHSLDICIKTVEKKLKLFDK